MEKQPNKGLPTVADVQKIIARYLEPKDLVALASSSKQMRANLAKQVLTAEEIKKTLAAAKPMLAVLKKKAEGLKKLMSDTTLSPILAADKKLTKVEKMRGVHDDLIAAFKSLKERKPDMSLEQLADYKALKVVMNELKAVLDELAPTL